MAGVTAFGETLRWLDTIDLTAAHDYTIALCDSAEQQLAALPGFRSYRSPAARCWPLISMVFITVISPRCWRKNIALRHGQHCAQPLCQALGTEGCLRVSFMPYNQPDDVRQLVQAVQFALEILADN